MELIKKLDASGVSINLTLNKLTNSKTLIGGCLTIIMYIFLIVMFYFSIQDVMQHKNPKINIVEELNENPSLIMSNSKIPIWFRLYEETNSIYIDKPEYFSFVFYYEMYNNEEKNEVKLNITKCKVDNFKLFSNELNEFYEFNDESFSNVMEKSYCIENQNFTLYGLDGSSISSSAYLGISSCRNNTDSSIKCAPIQEILEYVKNNEVKLEINYINRIINLKDFENPIKNYVQTFPSIKLQYDREQAISAYFSQLTVISNDNPLFDTNNIYESTYLDRMESAERYIDNYFGLLFYFQASNLKKEVTRRYTKIQEVLASIGGISNVLNIALKLTCLIFSTMRRDEILINEIFDFEMKKDKSNMGHELKSSVKNINADLPHDPHNPPELSFNSNSDYSKISNPSGIRGLKRERQFKKANIPKIELSQINMIKDPKQVLDILEQKKKKFTLRFSSWEIIKAYFCCHCVRSRELVEKMKLYNKSNTLILNFMDITHILKKLEEFEKLKIVIFNSEQLALFNFISKEFIYLNEEDIQTHILTRMKTLASKKHDLAKLIVNFKNKINSNEIKIKQIDKKLYDLLSDDLK